MLSVTVAPDTSFCMNSSLIFSVVVVVVVIVVVVVSAKSTVPSYNLKRYRRSLFITSD